MASEELAWMAAKAAPAPCAVHPKYRVGLGHGWTGVMLQGYRGHVKGKRQRRPIPVVLPVVMQG